MKKLLFDFADLISDRVERAIDRAPSRTALTWGGGGGLCIFNNNLLDKTRAESLNSL